MSFLGKEYVFYKQESCDDLLKHLGIPENLLKAVNAFAPPEKFIKDGDVYTYYTQNPKGPVVMQFESGVEIDDLTEDEPARSTFVVNGNTVMQTFKSEKNIMYVKREYNGDELVVTLTAEGHDGVFKRYYKA